MAAITGSTVRKMSPGPAELLDILYITPNTADSNDTLDVSTTFDDIKWLVAWDETSGDTVTATESSAVITIDASGGTTNHVYGVRVVGTAKIVS